MQVHKATGPLARAQAAWIAELEPWRGMGYTAVGLARWLGRMGRRGRVWVAVERGEVLGVAVLVPEVLLGDFLALVAVSPGAQGRGVGRRLVETIPARRRWLWVSSDANNRGAARFYRALGFERVARLSDFVRDGRAEVLWRRRGAVTDRPRPARVERAAARPRGAARRAPRRRPT